MQESLQAFENRNKNREPLVRIMGRIVLIDTKVSTLEDNPFNLLPGSTYYVCYVEPLRLRGIKKRAAALPAPVNTSTDSAVAGVKAEAGDATSQAAAEGDAGLDALKGLSLQNPTAPVSEAEAGKKGDNEVGKEGGKVPTPSSSAGAGGTKKVR